MRETTRCGRWSRWAPVLLLLLAAGCAPLQARQEAARGDQPRLSAEDEAFLEDLSRRSFLFFWEQTDPATGIIRDRSRTDGSPSSEDHVKVGSIASVGFGLTGLCIAAERGWVPRAEAVERARVTLRTFAQKLEHQHGWFYHWINVHTGAREWKSEVSSIDTALLLRLQRPDGIVQTMLDMVLYQHALGLLNGFFHRVKLLGQFQAGLSLVNHANHAFKMAVSSLQAFDDIRMRLMRVIIYHV